MENRKPSITFDCTIHIDENGTTVDLAVPTRKDVKTVAVSSSIKSDFSMLAEYPGIDTLSLSGTLPPYLPLQKPVRSLILAPNTRCNLSSYTKLAPQVLIARQDVDEGISSLFTDSLVQLEVRESRKIRDLTFLTKAPRLQKLLLEDLSEVTTLPSFSLLPDLYLLRLSQLHKLADIFPLAESNIKYLDIHFSADRVSGTRIAEVLLQMPAIDGASVSMIDEGKNNRYRIICKHLARMGRESIVWHVGGYAKWLEL